MGNDREEAGTVSTTIDDPRVETTISNFSTIYLGGIPPMITNDSRLSIVHQCSICDRGARAGFVSRISENRGSDSKRSLKTISRRRTSPTVCGGSVAG